MATNFLRNAWYIAAWDSEVSRTLFARDLLGESVLMFRKEDGTPVAMSNRCPHRFAPLHKGKLIGDRVECLYHGLQFDCSGTCVKNPHPGGDGPIPQRAKLSHYPLMERWGALWIWMGHKTPDPSLMPDFAWIETLRTVRGMCPVNANYQLITDNVLDLTHLPYLHSGGLGNAPKYLYNEVVENVREGDTFWCRRRSSNVEASPDFQMMNANLRNVMCDKANAARWNAPAHVGIYPSYWKHQTQDEDYTMIKIMSSHTPASEGKTWQFWCLGRDFAMDSENMDMAFRIGASIGLEKEDVQMIEAQYANMGTSDLFSLKLASLPGDITPNRVRLALRTMIERESAELPSRANDADVARDAQPAAETV